MRGSAFTERAMIERLARLFDSGTGTGAAVVERGIGDDAAVLRFGRRRLVWTVDVCVEGVHFDLRWLSLQDVGWRSLQAAASDIAAMGAIPLGALSSLVVPAKVADKQIPELARGQAEAARAQGFPMVGGNLSRGSELSVTTAVLGQTNRPLYRSGARPGDQVWLVGEVGLSAMGLELLKSAPQRRSARRRAWSSAERACIQAWRRPRALLREATSLVRCARAVIDVSDGLGGDAGELARASRVRLVLDEKLMRDALPSELISVCRRRNIDPLHIALRGGEDYALLVAGPAHRKPPVARVIGHVTRGSGVRLLGLDGKMKRVGSSFDHFSSRG
ncbi:MAG TPA: thiamine-phosphate kinase [Polyangiaceae bacterium]